MDDEGAAGALARAVAAALEQVAGLSGVSDGAPIQAGDAHAMVEMGPETDWGHKSGAGAELRFAVLIRCGGETPGRARALAEGARAAIGAVGPSLQGWRLVSLTMMRSRMVPVGAGRERRSPGWTGAVDYRARLLRED